MHQVHEVTVSVPETRQVLRCVSVDAGVNTPMRRCDAPGESPSLTKAAVERFMV